MNDNTSTVTTTNNNIVALPNTPTYIMFSSFSLL